MTIDITTTPGDNISLEDIQFHPLVRLRLMAELKVWTEWLEKVQLDRLLNAQGKVEILRWVLSGMLPTIIQEERERLKKAEDKE